MEPILQKQELPVLFQLGPVLPHPLPPLLHVHTQGIGGRGYDLQHEGLGSGEQPQVTQRAVTEPLLDHGSCSWAPSPNA